MVTDTNSYGGLTEEEYMLYLSTIIYSGAFVDENKNPINLDQYPTIGAIENFYGTIEELKAQIIEIVSSTQAYLSEATGIMILEDQSIAGKLKS